jgi:hypothetical protein
MPSDVKFVLSMMGERNVNVEHWWKITDRKTDVIGENLVLL